MAKDMTYTISRWSPTDEEEFLIVNKKNNKIFTQSKKFFSHGNLIDTDSASNGYHGRCENCGLPLVTDLGYNSWSNTKCQIEESVKEEITLNFKWAKLSKRASKLSENDSNKYFSKLITDQGWGKYNFRIVNSRYETIG